MDVAHEVTEEDVHRATLLGVLFPFRDTVALLGLFLGEDHPKPVPLLPVHPPHSSFGGKRLVDEYII